MSTSEALSVIAQIAGKESTTYRNACILAAHGRRADIIARATQMMPRRNLAIAA